MKKISIIIISLFTSVSVFAQKSVDLSNSTQVLESTFNDMIILSNAYSSVSLSMVSVAAFQLPVMSSALVSGSVISLVKAGSVATGVGGLAVASTAGAGYFFGRMIVTTDQIYLDGKIVDSVGKILTPVFYGAYKIQSLLEK
jgi:hypothetical protein